ncbi:hypothetical protein [Halocatena halophila]|uniref:hypothetical protein n=1 Tax=Halocatena halophila TaxID=2814576 RepID=UPI002ED6AD3D
MESKTTTELLTLLGFGVAAVVFTGGGLFIEGTSLHSMATGHQTVAYWEMYMGAIALILGVYLFGYRECWARVRSLRNH